MLKLAPVTLKEANAYVARLHRHHKPTVGHKFSIGCIRKPDEPTGPPQLKYRYEKSL